MRDVTALPIYLFDVIADGKRKGRGKETPRKERGYRVFPDVNRISRLKAVTSIPVLLGHYRRLRNTFVTHKVVRFSCIIRII